MGKAFAELYQNHPEFDRMEVEIPEFGGTFYYVIMRGDKHKELIKEVEELVKDPKESVDALYALTLSKLLMDSSGEYPKFEFLMTLSGKFLKKHYDASRAYNGIDQKSQAEIEKKSDPQEQADSSSLPTPGDIPTQI